MSRDTHHVVPHAEGWAVKRGGGEQASKLFETKEAAVDYAREVSRNQKTELLIHKEDGTITQSDSHGNDPFPPRG